MKLHSDIKFFGDTVRVASQNLRINEVFVEKDYWITLVLSRLAKSKYASETVFKGGTSLSKGFGLIDRFSEDVDIAIIDENNKSGNEIRTIIRTVEKEMTKELTEIKMEGVTSKGSKFRKSVFEYASIDAKNKNNKLIVEVNSFANPFPFQPLTIKSLLFDFLTKTDNEKFVEQYDLQPFKINVLNKEQTMLEKVVSLIRFSFEANASESLSKKIRHFYDLYFLMKDEECAAFIKSANFKQQFNQIVNHDKELFDEPAGWHTKSVTESPLITDFDNIWKQLRDIYKTELSALAYTTIPDEKNVAETFNELIKLIQ
ncbi:MAG: nucleotidyl transferase AbiEii/AbiGii toxin family protein [Ignavibacteriaceae bacterium]|jgi:predicted nucleotidyltransferase component of viral defense system|nr:nucleotidyl transferase AbiEii/AbiGii toxin family protein [Ignavibacteriaceae bacterium]